MGTYYNEIRNRLILAAVNVNDAADAKTSKIATNHSHYHYARLTAFAEMLEDLGHEVCVTKNLNVVTGCYSIYELKIDGKIVIENKKCIV